MAYEDDSSADGQLEWKSFPAGEAGFFRAPTLVFGPSEALLIDGGFTLADGRAVAEAISATGRKLTCIYVSQSDTEGLGLPAVSAQTDSKSRSPAIAHHACRDRVQRRSQLRVALNRFG